MSDKRLYADFKVLVKDQDGATVQKGIVEHAGSFTMEDVQTNALVHGVAEIQVIPMGFRMENDDGQTEVEVEAEWMEK